MATDELEGMLAGIAQKTGVRVLLAPKEGALAFSLEWRGSTREVYLEGGGDERLVALVRCLVAESEGSTLPTKGEALRMILLGEGGSLNAARFLTRFDFADGACYAVDIIPERRTEEVTSHVERCLEGTRDMAVRMDAKRVAAVIFSEEAPLEFARVLALSLYEELGVKASVGVGNVVHSFAEIALSYEQAQTAVRMSALFHSKGEVHAYREYLLVRLLEDVPQSRLKEYYAQFGIAGTEGVFGDADMLETAEAFLENSLSVAETSRSLYMHRNTLMYRLDKIARETGLDIRSFSDAVTFRVMSILYRLLYSKE